MNRKITPVLLSAIFAPAVALAQQPSQQSSQQDQAKSDSQQQARSQADQQAAAGLTRSSDFVAQAAVSNMFEIHSSQLALKHSKNNQVRAFAQQMVQDHSAAEKQLKEAAQGQNVPDELDQKHAQLMEQLQQESDGDQFDARYLQMQRQAHQQAIALFEGMNQQNQQGQQGAQGQRVQALRRFAEQTLPTLREHLKHVERVGQEVAPDAMATNLQGQEQDQSRIVVQRDAPNIQVEQASPHISVRQAQPEVSVNQPQPELIVQQPAPTVTVNIPQPNITVRMPQPQVQVAQAKPEIEVEQPQPKVEVQETDRPEVHVDGGQPVASVQGPQSPQPQINYEQAAGQPSIRYERAEPKIVVNKAKGEPQVRVERVAANNSDQQNSKDSQAQQRNSEQQAENRRQRQLAAVATGSAPNQGTEAAARQDEQRARIRSRFGLDDKNRPEGPDRDSAETRQLTVGDIKDMDVYNAQDEELGDVAAVVQGADDQQYIVIADGGFFGIGEDTASVPIERVWVQQDHLVVHGVTPKDIEAMDDYRDQTDQYRELADSRKAPVGIWE